MSMPKIPRIYQIEAIGRAWENKEISEEDAVRWVFDIYEGGITEFGAKDTLHDWRNLRTDMVRVAAKMALCSDCREGKH